MTLSSYIIVFATEPNGNAVLKITMDFIYFDWINTDQTNTKLQISNWTISMVWFDLRTVQPVKNGRKNDRHELIAM